MNILLHYLYGDLKSLSMRNRPFCALFEVAKMAENRRPGPFAIAVPDDIKGVGYFINRVPGPSWYQWGEKMADKQKMAYTGNSDSNEISHYCASYGYLKAS